MDVEVSQSKPSHSCEEEHHPDHNPNPGRVRPTPLQCQHLLCVTPDTQSISECETKQKRTITISTTIALNWIPVSENMRLQRGCVGSQTDVCILHVCVCAVQRGGCTDSRAGQDALLLYLISADIMVPLCQYYCKSLEAELSLPTESENKQIQILSRRIQTF